MIYIGKVMKKVSRHMKLFLGLVVFIACISLVKLKMFAADSLTVGEDYLKQTWKGPFMTDLEEMRQN